MAYLPPVVVEISGNTDGLVAAVARAKAALDGLKNSAGDIKLGVDVNTASIAKAAVATDALTAATTRTTAAGRRWTGWLAAAHNVLTVFGANIIADTIGIIAFGIGAVSALAPVVEVIKNLGAGYGDLSNYQKAATVQLTNFKNQFLQLSNPGIFAVVTGGLALIGTNLGRTGGIMDQATIAFENFVAMLRQSFASAPWQQMFSRSQGIIQQDLTALFRLINALINVIPALFHDFNGLGLFVISFATGVLHLIAVIGDSNPALMRFAAVVFLVYRALSMLGQFQAGSLLMRALAPALTAITAKAGDLGAAFALARTEGIGPALGALTALEGSAVVATGVFGLLGVGLVGLAFSMKNTQTPAEALISNLTRQDHATGLNVAGYEELSRQLLTYTSAQKMASLGVIMSEKDMQGFTTVLGQVSGASRQAAQTGQTLSQNLGYLEQHFHLTQEQAVQLAQKTGTNLFQAFAKGGGAAQQMRMKIQSYYQTVQAAQNPTTELGYDLSLAANKALGLTDRVTALTNAFNALLTPFANVIHDTVQWKDQNIILKNAVDKSHGGVNDLGNGLQRLSADALSQAITNTVNLSQATLQQTKSMQRAIGPVRAEIGVLQALHSKSSEVAQAIRILQQYINSLHSKSITLTTTYNSVYTHSGVGHATGPGGYASGTTSAKPGWAMVGEQGPELMYFKGGEKVIPNHALSGTGGYANGTGGFPIENHITVELDGQVISKRVEKYVYERNVQNGMRTKNGSVQGRFGIR